MRSVIICLSFLMMVMAVHDISAETPQPFPFASVTQHEDTILATFPSSGIRWIVKLNSDASHISNYNETITLHGNDNLVLAEKHISTKIIPIVSGDHPGLSITTTSSVSQVVNKKETLFIPVSQK